MRIIATLILLTACTNEASHVPNPLLLPVLGLGNAFQNASYDSRRAQIKTWITDKRSVLQVEAQTIPGPAMQALVEYGQTPVSMRPRLFRELAQISVGSPADWVENATVIVMVLSEA